MPTDFPAEALEAAGITGSVTRAQSLGGNEVTLTRLTLDTGQTLVAKSAGPSHEDRVSAEYQGLAALTETNLLLVPRVFGPVRTGHDLTFFMEWIDSSRAPDRADWTSFGRALAEHHAKSAQDRFGHDHYNFIGRTHQPNTWEDDWVEFNRLHRLGYQLESAQRAGLLPVNEIKRLEEVIDRLDEFIPRQPPGALLHGDLWSGNAIAGRAGERTGVFVIDPAVYHGDPWADIAMMRQFGGFPESCFEAYEEVNRDHELLDTRIRVYQLYHMLNHLNLFGGSYLASVSALTRALLRG